MTSSLFSKQIYLFEKLKHYWHSASERISRTPERSLDSAYQSVLKIKAIEDEHFGGQAILTKPIQDSTCFTSVLRTDVEKQLAITKMRLAEFKASCFVLGNLSTKNLGKLKLVEEFLAKYTISESLASTVNISVNTEPVNVDTITGQTAVLPRSIGRTLHKISDEFNPKAEAEYIRKYRNSRAKTKTAVRFIITLVIVPVLTQHFSKQLLISPIVEKTRGSNNSQVFINYEMKEEALHELQTYEEGLKFENLIHLAPPLSQEVVEEKVKHKASELAKEFHYKSNSAINNVFADILALVAFGLVIIISRKEIIVLKSFMDEIVYGLSDSAKAFIIILFTDMFVGFHSPHGWEVILEGIASHLGVAANKSVIGLFIATFPVILDTICKYWIFRYLSKISPSAVATLRNMNE
jgi:CemA family